MNTTYTFRNLDATEALKGHLQQQVSKLKKLCDGDISPHVILTVEKSDHRVEITMNDRGVKHVSHAESSDMYDSINQAVHKMEQQLRRRKQMASNHR